MTEQSHSARRSDIPNFDVLFPARPSDSLIDALKQWAVEWRYDLVESGEKVSEIREERIRAAHANLRGAVELDSETTFTSEGLQFIPRYYGFKKHSSDKPDMPVMVYFEIRDNNGTRFFDDPIRPLGEIPEAKCGYIWRSDSSSERVCVLMTHEAFKTALVEFSLKIMEGPPSFVELLDTSSVGSEILYALRRHTNWKEIEFGDIESIKIDPQDPYKFEIDLRGKLLRVVTQLDGPSSNFGVKTGTIMAKILKS